MKTPKLPIKYYAIAAIVIAVVLYAKREDIFTGIGNIGSLVTQYWWVAAAAVAIYAGRDWLNKKMRQEMEAPAKVLRWCFDNSPDFAMRNIYEESFDWKTYEPRIENSRLGVNFQLRPSGTWWFARIDSAAMGYKVSALRQGWLSPDDMKKMLQAEMTYETATSTIKDFEDRFEIKEKKEDEG